jgi:hypothetical protein
MNGSYRETETQEKEEAAQVEGVEGMFREVATGGTYGQATWAGAMRTAKLIVPSFLSFVSVLFCCCSVVLFFFSPLQ